MGESLHCLRRMCGDRSLVMVTFYLSLLLVTMKVDSLTMMGHGHRVITGYGKRNIENEIAFPEEIMDTLRTMLLERKGSERKREKDGQIQSSDKRGCQFSILC